MRRLARRYTMASLLAVLSLGGANVGNAGAQLTDPCGVGCTLVLSASSFTFATGTMVAVGRARGGYSATDQAILAWTGGFLTAAVTGVALRENGERQRRAAYGSGLGALAGAVAGVAVDSLLEGGTPSRRWAAALVGAAAGVAVGGAIGAVTYEGSDAPAPAFSVSVPFGPLGR